ncbi:MAG TPA: hypothetical protein DCZ03_02790 [Gammaproteobacteria bacterium]|nr:hypothetical protein [Gammaproteobacteria bacterium]
MGEQVPSISGINLAITFLPVALVLVILFRWSLEAGTAVYALIRMLAQLLIVGYFLNYLFAANELYLLLVVFSVMIAAASWIALRTVPSARTNLWFFSSLSIFLAGGVILWMVTALVLGLSPWYQPRYSIPLAGMIFANGMTSISLCAERLFSEAERETDYKVARNYAFQAALIPVVNSLFAVGVVTLPGMMTGQILSGVSPLVAVRYQVMVMCMLFASAGMTTYFFLIFCGKKLYHQNN